MIDSFQRKYKFLPFELRIPEENFLINLENKFYISIHNDLLTKQHLINDDDLTQQITFAEFKNEAVYLSKLLDKIKLKDEEIIKLETLYLQEYIEEFFVKFLESFNRYKDKKIIVNQPIALFFLMKLFSEF